VFQAPSKTTVQAALAEPIDLNQRYLVRLVSIHDEGVSKFADQSKAGEPEHSIRWVFRVARMDKMPLLNVDNTAFELWQWTSNRTGKDPAGKTPTAKARAWAEALLGRQVEDEEIARSGFEQQLINRVAVCLFDSKQRTYTDGTGQEQTATRYNIMRLSPWQEQAPASTTAPAPAAAPPVQVTAAPAVPAAEPQAIPF